jgi:peptidyl-dipeptidase Dcp
VPARLPLLSPSPLPFGAPDFSLLEDDRILPAFEEGMRLQQLEIEEIANNPVPPTFENTLEALERSGGPLEQVQRWFFSLIAAHTRPALQDLQAVLAPLLAAHSDRIHMNPALFSRIDQLWRTRTGLGLDAESDRLLERTRDRFIRAGALLDSEDQARVRDLNRELSSLSTQFERNLLSLSKERGVWVQERSELEGLSEVEIETAAEAARAQGAQDRWFLPLTNTTRQPALAHLRNRALRQQLWEASAERGIGQHGGVDNRPLVLRMAELRAERARQLGVPHWAAFALEPQMARSVEAARKRLTDLLPAVIAHVQAEEDRIRKRMMDDGVEGPVEPWDWAYYAERIRAEAYHLNEEEIRPYFELDRVLRDGVFFTMNRLFGIQFRERTDLPVYHPDVRVFDVFDSDGSPLGLFYGDFFQRESKRGGAWMSALSTQSRLLQRRPVVMNVLNIPKPPVGSPALLSFDQVTTLFHEMGHAVHGLLSDVRYPSLSGTAVPRDFVEFPSTFQEDWALHPTVLENYARRYDTDEPLPPVLRDRLISARHFNQGYDTLEYLAAALLDLDWHTLQEGSIPEDPMAFEAESRARYGVDLRAVHPRYRTPFFAHIFSGGYAASYYAYIWSEVLAADAFEQMRQTGGPTRANGNHLRNTVLSRGNSGDPLELYRTFRGSDPSVHPLLERRGLNPFPPEAGGIHSPT